jgi:eukaryotic-like serine/threonine-protein kinase
MADPKRVRSIFLEAVEQHTPDQWAVFLDQVCGDEAELRQRVELLLRAHQHANSTLDGAAPPPWATLDQPKPVATIDQPMTESGYTIIGPYKLLEQIGEGGMGAVWMAEQTEPIRRRVAVKVVREGMDSKDMLARFEAERQALALMDHPNIAKVLDAGKTPSGRPYFVMELVKGTPITKYCDEHRLGVRERLELFGDVCRAVQHAHQKGIIHRDLKPSNVLAATYDGKPVVKVIDFGVAKATGQRLTDKTLFTGIGAVVGTLEYMSPEQAQVSNEDIDTRSDIYSLGVMLYELLAGSPPFTRKQLANAGMMEMLRVIREQEPSKPSTKLSSSDALPTLSANRGTEPAKLPKLVRGELDWIVMKALEKDRGRRYETANGFAMDVQRYLAGEPVTAAPASQWYRLRKFVRLHRAPVAAAGLFLLTLVAGIAGTTWGLVKAERQQALAEARQKEAVDERDAKDAALKAEQQARADETKARQQAFAALRSMSGNVIEKKFAQGSALTDDDKAFLRSVIAQYDAFAAIKGDDAESRAARAEGRFRVGNLRRSLGEFKEAEQDFDQAIGIQKQLVSEFPERPEFRQDLTMSYNNRGNLLKNLSRMKDAEHDFAESVRILKQLAADVPTRPEFRHLLARSYVSRGLLLRATGRLQEAEQDYDQALSIQKQLAAELPSSSRFRQAVAESHMSRGLLLRAAGRLKDAEQDLNQALTIGKQLVADFPSRSEFREDLARIHTNRANLLREMGRLQEAKQVNDEALGVQKQLAADFPSKPKFRHDLSTMHAVQGRLLQDLGQFQTAENEFDQAVSIDSQLVADFPSQPDYRRMLAMNHGNRGNLLKVTNRLKESGQDYDQAVNVLKQLVTDFPTRLEFRQDLAKSFANRGSALHAMGRLKEAEQDLEQALSSKKQLATDFPNRPEFRQDLAKSHNFRGMLLKDTGRPKEAEQDYQQALSIVKQLAIDFPDQSEVRDELAHTYLKIAAFYQGQGNWSAAKRLLLEGRPHHLAALKANPRNRNYIRDYGAHLMLLTQVHAALLEPEGAVRTAEVFRDIGWDPPQDAFLAACWVSQCIPIVAKHDKLDDKQRQEAVQLYSDATMKLLHAAVSKGFSDLQQLDKDKGFDPLHQRDDFRKLVAELEAQEKKESP